MRRLALVSHLHMCSFSTETHSYTYHHLYNNLSNTDLNECSTDNAGCSDTCTNTDGGFVCSCPTGYVVAADFRNCMGKRASKQIGRHLLINLPSVST